MSDTPRDPTPAERWFRLAEEDLHAGRVLVAEGSAALRIAGFLAQQGWELVEQVPGMIEVLDALGAVDADVAGVHDQIGSAGGSVLDDRLPLRIGEGRVRREVRVADLQDARHAR